MSKDILKAVPEMLRNPVVIAEDIRPNNINVFGNVWVGGSPVLIGIVVTKDRAGRNVINKIRTVHARRDAAQKISDESVLYLDNDKKRTRDWFQAIGTHLPLGGTKFGFIRSITLSGNIVNPKTQYQPRDEQISIREILANVLENASTNADEMAWLKGYRKELKELDKKFVAISQNRQTIRELMCVDDGISPTCFLCLCRYSIQLRICREKAESAIQSKAIAIWYIIEIHVKYILRKSKYVIIVIPQRTRHYIIFAVDSDFGIVEADPCIPVFFPNLKCDFDRFTISRKIHFIDNTITGFNPFDAFNVQIVFYAIDIQIEATLITDAKKIR